MEEGLDAPFGAVDRFAIELGVDAEDPRRAEAGILFELNYNLNAGHSFLPEEKLIIATAELLSVDHQTIRDAAQRLLEAGRLVRDHLAGIDILYLPQDLGYTAAYTDTEMLVIHFLTRRSDKHIEVYPIQDSGRIYKLFLRAYALWQNKEPGYQVYAMSQLYDILGTILETQTKTNLPPHFLQAVSYINANYRSSLTVQSICENAGIGATMFRQLFKQHYHKTPVAYITELRLECARSLIAGGMPIEQASMESGFNDAKYFARVVKKYFDCTPRDLKNYGKQVLERVTYK
jgi:AraC-like DNA-binding protein